MLKELKVVRNRIERGSSIYNAIDHDHVYEHIRTCIPRWYRGDLRKFDEDTAGCQWDRINFIEGVIINFCKHRSDINLFEICPNGVVIITLDDGSQSYFSNLALARVCGFVPEDAEEIKDRRS